MCARIWSATGNSDVSDVHGRGSGSRVAALSERSHGDEVIVPCICLHILPAIALLSLLPSSRGDLTRGQVILVDDRIPCDENGLPAFARNVNPNAFWVMIIEKAYAKFAKNYEAVQVWG
eukprot:6177955-Pleurochrysis_carterae.AAC.8